MLLIYIEPFIIENRIIGVDFNTTFNPFLDKKDGISEGESNQIYRGNILAALEDFNRTDIWREQHPDKNLYTYSCKNPLVLSRIGFCIVHYFISLYAYSGIQASIKTVHSVISLEFIGKVNQNWNVIITFGIK